MNTVARARSATKWWNKGWARSLVAVSAILSGLATIGGVAWSVGVAAARHVTNQELKPLQSSLNSLGERVAKIEGRLDGIDKRLDGLDRRLDVIEPAVLKKLSFEIQAARRSRTRIDAKTISSLGETVLAIARDRPDLAGLAWNTADELFAYRSFLNASLAPSKSTTPLPRGFDVRFHARMISKPFFLGIVGMGSDVPVSRSARFQEIGSNAMEAYAEAPEYFVIDGTNSAEISIDGYEIKNVVIKNARIKYDGGPLIMQNVYFVYCAFDLPRTPSGQRFGMNLLSLVPMNFKNPRTS